MLPSLTPESIEAAIGLSGYRTFAIVNPAIELQKAQHKLRGTDPRSARCRLSGAQSTLNLPEFENRLLCGTTDRHADPRDCRAGGVSRAVCEVAPLRAPTMERLWKASTDCRSIRFRSGALLLSDRCRGRNRSQIWRWKTFVDRKRNEYPGGPEMASRCMTKARCAREVNVAPPSSEHDSLLAEQKALSEGRHGCKRTAGEDARAVSQRSASSWNATWRISTL